MLEAIVLGIVQGLTEFLPVSSTAHLIIIPFLFGWKDPGLTFDVALHFGTLLALIFYFYKDILKLLKASVELFTKRTLDFYQKLVIYIIVATIPAGILGLLLEDMISSVFRSHYVIVFTLIFIGILLWYIDFIGKKNKDIKDLTILYAFIIGLFQALALVPGVSRSGITIIGALILGFTRESAARFAFLIGMPIIAAGSLFEARNLHFLTGDEITIFIVGVISSALSGFLCIKYFLKYLTKASFEAFALYRILLGFLLLSLLILG